MRTAIGFALILACAQALPASAAQRLDAAQAASHIGQQASVCGVVASAKYAARSRGAPTFLNLDHPYPHPIFTALIWGEDRNRFSPPPEALEGTRICVSGLIQSYRGTPEIIVHTPGQITPEN